MNRPSSIALVALGSPTTINDRYPGGVLPPAVWPGVFTTRMVPGTLMSKVGAAGFAAFGSDLFSGALPFAAAFLPDDVWA